MAAYNEATSTGVGAIAMGAEMIDAAHVRMARRTLELAGESET
jgi:citrate lyase beta subunit